MDFKICSLNARGIGETLKRRKTFNWLRAKKFSIYLLQETHCSENTTATWSSEWGYKTLFSCCSGTSGGVTTFFNNNFPFQLQRSYSDPKGRFIICHIKKNGRLFTLATIYFNLVLNPEKDKKGGLAKTHTKAVNVYIKKGTTTVYEASRLTVLCQMF